MKQEFKKFVIKLERDRSFAIVLHYPRWCRWFLRFFELNIYAGFRESTIFFLNLDSKIDGIYKEPIHMKEIEDAWVHKK